MMSLKNRALLIGVGVWMASAVASAETLRLPAGATWLVTAPSAKSTSASFAPLLKNTATWSVAITHLRVNFELQQDTGFALLDAVELSKQGVDTTKSWAIFDHGGVRHLGLFLSTKEAFDARVSKWAGLRGLPFRSESTKNGVKKVTWSRTAGARAAMGYARREDVAVVLLDAGGRTDALEAALRAWDGAAPVKAPVHGALVGWSASWRGAKDVWAALSPRADGIDVDGRAREASGWFVRDAAQGKWVAGGASKGLEKEIPFRIRTTPGAKMFALLESLVKPALNLDVLPAPMLQSTRAVELMSLKVDADKLKSSSRKGALDWAGMLSPLMRLHLSKPVKSAKFAAFHLQSDASGALLVPVGNVVSKEMRTVDSSELTCQAGSPVAAMRLDAAQVSESLLPVGLISAMRNEILLGVFGVQAEYGHLLRASRPMTALICQDANGRIAYRASWSFTPR